MLCYGSRGFAIGPGSVWSYVVIWLVMRYAHLWLCLCSGMYGDLKPSGVMLCVAPASEWRPRSWALHDFRLHYVYVYDLIWILTLRFVLHFVFWFAFGFDPYFCTPCFTYSVHISYWPPFFGGCVLCPQVQKLVWVILRFRLLILLFWSAPSDPESTFGIDVLCYAYTVYIWLFGYGGGPVSPYVFVLSS